MRPTYKVLNRPDFTYEVSMPRGHSWTEVREWLTMNRIPYIYSTGSDTTDIKYLMTQEAHLIMFKLRWI